MGFAEFWVFAVIFLFLVLSSAAITVPPGRALSSFHVIIWDVRVLPCRELMGTVTACSAGSIPSTPNQ